jgi:VIT1/CCC1 family predicted Fe2+/Mn2+ transporter
MDISNELRQQLLAYQKNEITEHHIYHKLAGTIRCAENRAVLEKIANDELRHYQAWLAHTQQAVRPDNRRIWTYYWISRLLGFTFGVKLMERGEGEAERGYAKLIATLPEAAGILHEEEEHETAPLQMLDEERLRYTGSMVLGLNDALVELTGALAGFTLALQNTRLIALTGSITGVAAALSMAASEYLSVKSEDTSKNPARASLYTGTAYLATVLVLILPYLLLQNYYLCLACTLLAAVAIIAFFNYYISVAKDVPFRRRFLEMAGLSLAVAAFSFFIGFVLRMFLGVEA